MKGVRSADYRDTGNPKTAVRIYSAQDADELVFLDIQASLQSQQTLVKIIEEAATECFMPLAAGGGIRSIEDVRALLKAGADKVVVNTAAVTDPQLVTEIVKRFGTQSLIVGIDYRHDEDSSKVWIRCGTEKTQLDPVEHAVQVAELGAGEILLNSIDRDGVMKGYDLLLADKVSQAVNIPVIVCGGAGNFKHIAELLKGTQASAAACASVFHFEITIQFCARSYLRNSGVDMRVLK